MERKEPNSRDIAVKIREAIEKKLENHGDSLRKARHGRITWRVNGKSGQIEVDFEPKL